MPPTSERGRPSASDSQPAGVDLTTDAALLGLALIWGINFSVIKVALEELQPLAFNALRFPLASLVLLALMALSGRLKLPARRDWPRIALLGVLGNVAYQLFFIFGIDRTTAGNASLLLATTPIWTLLLSVLSGHERPSAIVWAGVMGTAGGMSLVVGGGSVLELGPGTWTGDALMIGSAILWSVYTVGARDLIHRYGSLETTAWTLWVGTLGLVALGIPSLASTPLRELSGVTWIGVVYAGTLAISVAYAIWYRGVGRLGNARTAAYSNLVPVVALGTAWLWLGERPSTLQMVGALVILVGLSLARLGRPHSSGAARNPARDAPDQEDSYPNLASRASGPPGTRRAERLPG